MFGAWLLLVGWLVSTHVLWRDEVRAFSLALSGGGVAEMLRNIHGEGHPALWYLILRGAHALFPYREVLPITALLVGVAAMGLFALRAPFRTWLVALVLFSLFGAFEYVVVARNYGISALAMFLLAAIYPRVKNTAWFGLILCMLCNTNVPSCILAAAFLLFRSVEMVSERERRAQHWSIFGINCALSLVGAGLSFAVVYPPFNDGAVSLNYGHVSTAALGAALGEASKGFSHLVLNSRGWIPPILLWGSCLLFIRRPAGLAASIAALCALKLFFFFVYPSGYRHEALFLVFLLALKWMVSEGAGGSWSDKPWIHIAQSVGTAAFVILLAAQTLDLAKPLYFQVKGVPYSRSAEVARLLAQPGLSRAIVMADPDLMLEPLPYYTNNPLWFSREGAFGKVFLRSRADRRQMSLDDMLADAQRLERRYGKPVVILVHLDLRESRLGSHPTFYRDTTILTREGVQRFLASTRLIARLRPAISDESYDIYVYGA